MASIRKTNSGKYKAEVFKPAVFENRQPLRKNPRLPSGPIPCSFSLIIPGPAFSERFKEFTVLDIFQKWQKEVLPKRNGKRWDRLKLQHIMSWPGWNVRIIENLQATMIVFRDYRLQSITNNSCNREIREFNLSDILTCTKRMDLEILQTLFD